MIPMHYLFATLMLAASAPLAAAPFVFRGQLDDGAAPAEGRYALRLTLYAAGTGAVPLAGPLELLDVPLSAGRFAVDVDFGALPPYAQGWLEVAAKADGEADYTALEGRTAVELKAAATCPASWSLDGNALTNPSLHFLGTTDAQPLELRVNGVRLGRFENVALPNTSISTANVMLGGPGNVVDPGVYGATVLGSGLPPGFSAPPDYPAGFSYSNRASDIFSAVLGGLGNVAGDETGTIQSALGATVAGGVFNRASGHSSIVLGGNENQAVGDASVAGGMQSSASGLRAIALGTGNTASGANAVALGGAGNVADGTGSVVLGGVSSAALRDGAVAIGSNLCAGAPYSWAGGHDAKVRPPSGTGSDAPGSGCDGVPNTSTASGDHGTFIWADNGGGPDFVSAAANEFAIRARGGVRLNNQTSQFFGDATRQMLNLYSETYGIGVQNSTLYLRSNGGFAWFEGGQHADTANDPGGGTLQMRLDGSGNLFTTGAVNPSSDRNLKTAFAQVDQLDVLARVLALPLSEWSYKASPDQRHVGPMAQDFRAAFGLGWDDKTIATIDADGVALAAIQGLNAKLEAENAALRAQDQALLDTLDAMRAELDALRLRLDRSRP